MRNEIFDSWATRFGALAILTTAQVVFEGQKYAESGILIGITILSLSCYQKCLILLYVFWTEFHGFTLSFKKEKLLKFIVFSIRDSILAMGMVYSTTLISLYNVPEFANKILGFITILYTLTSWIVMLSIMLVLSLAIFLLRKWINNMK